MGTTTATPTVQDLQAQVEKLETKVADLIDQNLQDQFDQELVAERETQREEAVERFIERVRDVLVREHDDAEHPGAQTYCGAGLCRSIGDLLDTGLDL